MREHTVGEVMTRAVVTVAPGTPAPQVVRLLNRHRISAVPVLDNDERVVGVVSRTDLAGGGQALRSGAAAPEPGAAVAARHLMTTPAITIHPEQRVKDAARVMERRHVDRLPVVDPEDRLIGITTRRDLLRVFLRTDEEVRTDAVGEVRRVLTGLWPGEVGVSVRDGLVTLTGSAATDQLSKLITSLWRVDGVTGVLNLVETGR
ncbi:CBS domain-containing protein [Streptomyces pakalii]|uniref:CBS domain-containing protein n=1 Tax=Streptomyces pakalii TaxID=3036494 RepID=A0ABT7DA90_9ACTN|nr:CBS domain-containing protein [Streptomyces pakalii]MDJ1642730.1 CBS domain-containing protein [Streptomyces pakalii]